MLFQKYTERFFKIEVLSPNHSFETHVFLHFRVLNFVESLDADHSVYVAGTYQ